MLTSYNCTFCRAAESAPIEAGYAMATNAACAACELRSKLWISRNRTLGSTDEHTIAAHTHVLGAPFGHRDLTESHEDIPGLGNYLEQRHVPTSFPVQFKQDVYMLFSPTPTLIKLNPIARLHPITTSDDKQKTWRHPTTSRGPQIRHYSPPNVSTPEHNDACTPAQLAVADIDTCSDDSGDNSKETEPSPGPRFYSSRPPPMMRFDPPLLSLAPASFILDGWEADAVMRANASELEQLNEDGALSMARSVSFVSPYELKLAL